MSTRAAERDRGEIGLFNFAGIRIRLDYSWFIIFLLLFVSLAAGYFPNSYPGYAWKNYVFAALSGALLFFISIVAHELAHSFTARRLGVKIEGITLFLFGGVAEMSTEASNSDADFRIAVAGPLMSFFLSGVFYSCAAAFPADATPLLSATFRYLAVINFAIAIFNLLPGYPLDGGRIFRAIVWSLTGSFQKATRAASHLGQFFAFALMFLGALQIFAGYLVGGIWTVFIAIFLRGMALAGYQEAALGPVLTAAAAKDVMNKDVISVPPSISLKQLIQDFFLRYTVRAFPVMEDGRVLGLVSLEKLKDVAPEEQDERHVSDVMTPVSPENTVSPDASLNEVVQKMNGANQLLVMEQEQMVGVVSKGALLRYLEIQQIASGLS